MNINIVGLSLLSIILVFFTCEFSKAKNYMKIFGIVILSSIILFLFSCDIWHVNIFSLTNWRLLTGSLIVLSFFVVLNIIEEKTFDVYLLSLLVLTGSLIIVMCDHLLIIYLGLELQTFSFFILIAKNRSSIKGSEAGLKYFILGALSSGLYLLGLCLFFLSGVSLNLSDVLYSSNDVLIVIGSILILLSFAFKLALFPLHFWIPDIYEGSSWDVISLLSTLPKISVLTVLMQLSVNLNLLLFCSLLSIIIGTLGALNQSKLKRLLAYSGVSHMGFIVLGYNLLSLEGYEVSYIYIVIYMITMLSVFLMVINSPWKKDYYIIELSGLQYVNRLLALTWLVIFLSIAGIPPLSGFISKWFILWNTMTYGYLTSSIVAIIFSAVGAGYYLRVVKITYFQKQASYLTWNKVLRINRQSNETQFFLLGIGVFFTVFLIINPNPLISMVNFVFFYFY
uniref:NADH:ubiquinone reductase (H(+)-translocating) n=1 Tax=Staurostoma mertensii TaxID=1804149 RepID=A0A0S2IB97_9CNID|nr:NADH dehydrogenase subunit 2 [Staurostoma mertensii]